MIPSRVREVLEHYSLTPIVFDEGTTPTAPLAAQALGVQVGQIAKSLLFKGKDERFYMVICPGDRKVSNSKLKKTLGVKTRMATSEETREITGFDPGGVCPFGVSGVEVILDRELVGWEIVYPAAGTSGSGVPLTAQMLKDITTGRFEDVSDPVE